jgi:hypothetical protein
MIADKKQIESDSHVILMMLKVLFLTVLRHAMLR